MGDLDYKICSSDWTFYHGTDVYFTDISLSKAKPFKDFGKGFYLTTVLEQAIEWAEKKAGRNDRAYVYKYEVSKESIGSDMRILEHLRYTVDWLDLITECRMNDYEPEYDIIYDRMADGDVDRIVSDYSVGRRSATWALNDLRKWQQERDQYCFKTNKALDLLNKTDEIRLVRESSGWSRE